MTDNLKETADEVKEYIVARLKVPVFFYYLLTLAIWNWDIILLILKSNFEIESIIWFIKTNYSNHDRLWKPFLIAVGSSVFFPAVMVGLDWFLKFVNKERIKSAKQVAEAEAEAQYDIQAKRNKTNELGVLNNQIEELNKQNKILIEERDSKGNSLTDELEKNKKLILLNKDYINKEKQNSREIEILKKEILELQSFREEVKTNIEEGNFNKLKNLILLEKDEDDKDIIFENLRKKINLEISDISVLTKLLFNKRYFRLETDLNYIDNRKISKLIENGILEISDEVKSSENYYRISKFGKDFLAYHKV